uniref:Membrane spanning 4-domains A4A n=1 Tax=Homo sapiens TaxID=9606 RepID=A0A7P0Z422_HUMAN
MQWLNTMKELALGVRTSKTCLLFQDPCQLQQELELQKAWSEVV